MSTLRDLRGTDLPGEPPGARQTHGAQGTEARGQEGWGEACPRTHLSANRRAVHALGIRWIAEARLSNKGKGKATTDKGTSQLGRDVEQRGERGEIQGSRLRETTGKDGRRDRWIVVCA